MSDKLIVSYIAGLFDGEGHVMINVSHGYTRLRVGIANNDIRVLKLVKRVYGGAVHKHSRQSKRHVLGYQWELANKSSKKFLEDILKFSIIKRERIILGLQFLKHKNSRFRYVLSQHPSKFGTKIWTIKNCHKVKDFSFRKKMKRLNKRGPKDD